jgi:hypothetical protein
MKNNSELSFYMDTLIVQEALLDDAMIKRAGVLNTVKDSIVSYFESHADPNDKVGTLLNFLAPGAISMLIGGWLGPTFGLAMRVLNIDVASVLRSLYNGVKELVSDNKPVTSSQVDGLVNEVMQSNVGQGVQTASFNQQLRDARLLKLAVIDLHQDRISADELKKVFAYGRRDKTISILGKLLSWILKVAISSAGLMVAGDAVNKMLGRPNAFDKTIEKGKPVETSQVAAPAAKVSTQTKFPVNPSYNDVQHTSGSWVENYPNTQSGVENMLLSFVKEVYKGLDGLDSVIKSTPGFKATVDEILWFNHAAAGDPIVFLPKFFTSKKQLVDHFIDDIAAKSP